jgi:hypothetical protein
MTRPAAWLVGLAAFVGAGSANAYCRTSVCSQVAPGQMPFTAAVCTPPNPDDCGKTLFRAAPCVEYSLQQDGSAKLGFTVADMQGIMQSAFATWMNAPCPGGGTPHILVSQGPNAVCNIHEYNPPPYGNANVIMFHDDSWPYEGSPNTLALTTVTYDLNTGEIYDADMELNSADNHFTLGDTNVDFDLLSIVTHESGHFNGLAHSHDQTAVMWPDYVEHTINLRHLSPDDVAGICAIYPPAGAVTNCDATPRHGFSAVCQSQQVLHNSCCTVAPGSDSRSPRPAVLLALLGALSLLARSRRRAR